jgi:phage-related holin
MKKLKLLLLAIATGIHESFSEPLIKLWYVYSNPRCLTLGFSITALWTAFRIAFERDHNISFALVSSIMWLVLIDTSLGFWKSIKMGRVSSSGFGKLFTKLIIYWLFIKMVDKVIVVDFLTWAGDLFLSGLIIREAISIIENMDLIYPGIIPPWISRKLHDFDDDGEINKSN